MPAVVVNQLSPKSREDTGELRVAREQLNKANADYRLGIMLCLSLPITPILEHHGIIAGVLTAQLTHLEPWSITQGAQG